MSVTNHNAGFWRRYQGVFQIHTLPPSYRQGIAAQKPMRSSPWRYLLWFVAATIYAVLLAALFYGAWQLAQAGVLGGGKSIMAIPNGTNRTVEDLVDRAFVDLRHRSDLPQSLKDLFWNGFGRAMA